MHEHLPNIPCNHRVPDTVTGCVNSQLPKSTAPCLSARETYLKIANKHPRQTPSTSKPHASVRNAGTTQRSQEIRQQSTEYGPRIATSSRKFPRRRTKTFFLVAYSPSAWPWFFALAILHPPLLPPHQQPCRHLFRRGRLWRSWRLQ